MFQGEINCWLSSSYSLAVMPNLYFTFFILGRLALPFHPCGSLTPPRTVALSASYSKSKHLLGVRSGDHHHCGRLLSLGGNTAHALNPCCCPCLGWGRASGREWEVGLCGSCWNCGSEGCLLWMIRFFSNSKQPPVSPITPYLDSNKMRFSEVRVRAEWSVGVCFCTCA